MQALVALLVGGRHGDWLPNCYLYTSNNCKSQHLPRHLSTHCAVGAAAQHSTGGRAGKTEHRVFREIGSIALAPGPLFDGRLARHMHLHEGDLPQTIATQPHNPSNRYCSFCTLGMLLGPLCLGPFEPPRHSEVDLLSGIRQVRQILETVMPRNKLFV